MKLKALIYPENLYKRYTLHGILESLGWEWTSDPDDSFDFAMSWNKYADKWSDSYQYIHEILTAIYNKGIPVFNYHISSTTKEHIEKIHNTVFGYGAFIDPCVYVGAAIEKSNKNSMHDGRNITCPLPLCEIQPEKVYMRDIDTRTEDGNLRDVRTIINDCRPSGVSILYKYPHEKFIGARSAYDLENGPPEIAFSPDEIDKITVFCKSFGLDCGELDVLRDNRDGLIYIVDVNPTAGSYKNYYDPSLKCYKYLNEKNRERFLERQQSFLRNFYELPFKQMVSERIDESRVPGRLK